MTADPSALAEEGQRRAADPATSIWVAASAGTGKTKVLTDRVLSLLLAGTRPQNILCLTFTKAAAAEMATRIAERLGQWAKASDEDLSLAIHEILGREADGPSIDRARRLFADVLDTPGGLGIQTIHAFCQSLLRRFPLESGVAPHFSVMDERDAAEMLAAARDKVLARARDGEEDLARALARIVRDIHETAFPELMAELAVGRVKLERLIRRRGSRAAAAAGAFRRLGIEVGETPESVVGAASVDDAFDALGLRVAVLALVDGSPRDAERGGVIAEWIAAPADQRERAFPQYAGAFLSGVGSTEPARVRNTLITKAAAKKAPGARTVLDVEAERLAAVEARRRGAWTATATDAILGLGESLLAEYAAEKERRALLDYDDLIVRARALLERPGLAPWVLYKLDGGIDHILIDEAQDTNPEQWRVIEALAQEFLAGEGARDVTRTVFAVGDVKQSIFSFQGAEPSAFERMREHFAAGVRAASGGWDEVELGVSFRSTPAVLEAVDRVFADADARRGVALDGRRIAHRAARHGDAGLVELWPPVEQRPADAPTPWKPPIDRVPGDDVEARLARLVAARIQRMVQGGEMLESRGRPIQARDIMVLVRRRGRFGEELVRALKERGVAVTGVDRMVLTEQMAVMDLIAFGRFALMPDDDLTLATVLKGPLIGLGEDDLFALAHGREGRLWDALRARVGERQSFADAEARLSDVLARADATPPYEFYAHILGPGGGREKLVRRLGFDAEDPIAEFLDKALVFERSRAPSLEDFLHWLEAGAIEVKRDLERERRDAVRLMTVHGAKGLQAPIVFLPDTMQVPARTPRLLWADGETGSDGAEGALLWPPSRAAEEDVCAAERGRLAERRDAEHRRLLYVAMTRAEDRLYVCGWSRKRAAPEGCWYNLILRGIEGAAATEHDEFLAGAEEIDAANVLRVTSAQVTPPPVSAPPETGEDAEPLPLWAKRPAPAETPAKRPLAPSVDWGDEPPVLSPLGPDGGARFKRGRLIHALLQHLADADTGMRAPMAAAYLARAALALTPAEQDEIATVTLAVLNDAGFAPLFGPGSRAEVPLVATVGEQMVSARLDRLLVEPETVTMADFKTNRAPPADAAAVPVAYLRQMAVYREALRQIFPEKRVRCALLWTDVPRLMALPESLLDAQLP
ncbi:MAG TPA: double-strand break repair helicase AddA [Rhodospirillales bacterium]|nr:double-strand break repair helicase AddA [Rhodospirillales bacterium]